MDLIIPKFPNKEPTTSSSNSQWADYIEYLTIFKGQCGIADYLRPIFKSSDELVVLGIDNDDDNLYIRVDEIVEEIYRRIKEGNGNYPFQLIAEDYVLMHDNNNISSNIYKFLHYSTYLNMGTNRSHSGEDGAKLFEEFSGIIAKNYLGLNTAGGVFGTAIEGGFKDKLQKVMDEMGEGGRVKTPIGAQPQDEDIDIIIWKPFLDKRRSMLICFGQCKTGLSWEKNYTRLALSSIINNWFTDAPIVEPVLMFFCSKYFNIGRWGYNARKYGIVFDRFRILGLYFNDDANRLLLKRINKWVEGVEKWLSGSQNAA